MNKRLLIGLVALAAVVGCYVLYTHSRSTTEATVAAPASTEGTIVQETVPADAEASSASTATP